LSAGERDAKAPAAGIPLHGAAQVFGGQPSMLAQVGDRQVAGHWRGAGSTELSEPQLFGDPVAAGLVDQQLQTLDPTAHPSRPHARGIDLCLQRRANHLTDTDSSSRVALLDRRLN
jgi:hypothetical protein